jgi:hypothetical protein
MEEKKFNFPTEIVELPSKGLLYPKDSPLAEGRVEMKYMTAREEDILSNTNYLKQGIWLDKLLQSMIVSKINYNDLLLGDKDALILAARILGYGKDYSFRYTFPSSDTEEIVTVDLSSLREKEFDISLIKESGKNEFTFKFPTTSNVITFKLLTVDDEKLIEKETVGLKKLDPKGSFEISTKLKHMILSVNGDYENKTIREFVDYGLLSRDIKSLREYINSINPGIDMSYTHTNESGVEEDIIIPVGLNFFWPDF